MAQYIEYEIRTVASDSRLYNTAKFPTHKETGKTERVPDFEKDFGNSVFMKYEEIPPPPEAAEGENEEEEFEERKFFRRRRRWYHNKEYRWVMSDKDQKHVYHGTEDGPSSSKYVVLMPPGAESEPFRLVPVQKWFTFKAAPKYKSLPLEKALEALEKERNITSSFMKKLSKRKEEESEESTKTISARKKKKVKFDDEYNLAELGAPDKTTEEKEEERAWFTTSDGKPKKRPNDDDQPNNEDDVEIMAIDRMGASGHGGSESFADFEEDFDDDEDDAGELAAEEVREERFMQSAEDMREATEEVDNELEEAEEEEELIDADEFLDDEEAKDPYAQAMEDEEDEIESERRQMMMQKSYFKSEPLADRKRRLSPKSAAADSSGPAKKSNVSEESNASSSAANSTAPAKETKQTSGAKSSGKGKSPLLQQIENKVVEIIRLNGGKIKTKQLSKQIKKEFPISKQCTKEQRAEMLRKAVLNLCTIVNDAVEGTYLVLK
mmetsp:Transcript_33266/g.40830  ORF Transcript_33266/g.40830 Transcript_33266/m.40830 type:complete len:494 (-) Transcript_33266:1044-2525(-)